MPIGGGGQTGGRVASEGYAELLSELLPNVVVDICYAFLDPRIQVR
jgi:hypothetical protein